MKKISKDFVKRFLLMCVANIILALGIAGLRLSNFGTDPFNCMNLGVSSHIPLSYGTYQLLVNLVLFIPLVIIKPKILGPGAIVNMFLLAYIVEFFTWLFGVFGLTAEGIIGFLAVRILCLVLGILCVCYGVALYMECNMGTAAYDALGTIIEEKSKGKLQYRWIRVTTDVICVAIGFITGSVVGVGTLISAFFTGPLVSLFRKGCRKLI